MYTRATHEREIQLLSTIRGASIDGWKSGDHRSNLGSNISFLPSRRSLRRIFSSTEDPRSRGATRACASPFLLLQRSSRRGCLLLPSSSCDPAGRYLGTTGHPGGPLTRHDRPWDTGRNAPRSKRRASERSSIFSTRPPRCFRVIRRETTTGFSTVAGL